MAKRKSSIPWWAILLGGAALLKASDSASAKQLPASPTAPPATPPGSPQKGGGATVTPSAPVDITPPSAPSDSPVPSEPVVVEVRVPPPPDVPENVIPLFPTIETPKPDAVIAIPVDTAIEIAEKSDEQKAQEDANTAELVARLKAAQDVVNAKKRQAKVVKNRKTKIAQAEHAKAPKKNDAQKTISSDLLAKESDYAANMQAIESYQAELDYIAVIESETQDRMTAWMASGKDENIDNGIQRNFYVSLSGRYKTWKEMEDTKKTYQEAIGNRKYDNESLATDIASLKSVQSGSGKPFSLTTAAAKGFVAPL